ncbi:MAG: methyl-accepting chemotaxis protein [Deltaproteobacteria bacterium]|jgi:methyl-accepting chemotaxis protein|nr:methyl-accepting chemotaxis protein [Deltaproteobacteria bacterium]
MKLGTKIIFGFLAICAIFVVIISVVIFSLMAVNQETDNLGLKIMPANAQAANVLFSAARGGLNILDYGYSNSEKSLTLFNTFDASTLNSLANLKNLAQAGLGQNNPKVIELLATADRQYQLFHEEAKNLPAQINAIISNRGQAIAYFESLSKDVEEYRVSQLDQLREAISQGVSGDAMQTRFSRIEMAMFIKDRLDDYYIEILRGLYYQKPEHFINSIELISNILEESKNLLKQTSQELNRSQLTKIVESAQTSSNVSALFRDIMVKYLDDKEDRDKTRTETLEATAKLAEALTEMTLDFTLDTKSSLNASFLTMLIGGCLALIISGFLSFILTRNITGPINLVIGSLAEGAKEVDQTSDELSISSNTLAEGATENAASLEQTSAALEELSSMTKRNADNAVEANALMSQATDAVGKAELSMSSVIEAMNHIATSGNEIGKIIKTIDEIAFQTNLLALNAAVEAARAGEAGAGFAVVADEVRNLAIRSADAAKNTADLIAATIANINSGSEMVNFTSVNFKTVSTHTAKVAQLVSEVAEASKEQSQGINQIATAMTQMDKVTQSNAASAEESASAAGKLAQQASSLMNAVSHMSKIVHGGGGQKTEALPAPGSRSNGHGRSRGQQSVIRSTQRVNPKALPLDDDNFEF